MKVDGLGAQTDLGKDIYEITFRAIPGQTYRITLNKDLTSSGLYSIVLRGIVLSTQQRTTAAIPVIDQRLLVLLVALCVLMAAGVVRYRKRGG